MKSEQRILGERSALLSLTEVSIGSLFHALKIPLSGQALSLNQIFVLAYTTWNLRTKIQSGRSALVISNVTALLKSLSPAGQKLTPMLAISAQGFLFSLPIYIFGVSRFSLVVAGICSGSWALLQPFLMAYILLGQDFFVALQKLLTIVHDLVNLDSALILQIFILVVVVKIVFSGAISFASTLITESKFDQYVEKLGQLNQNHSSESRNSIWRNLFRPSFILSLVVVVIYFYFVQSNWASLIWALLRPLAMLSVAWIALQYVHWSKVVDYFKEKGHTDFAEALQVALERVAITNSPRKDKFQTEKSHD